MRGGLENMFDPDDFVKNEQETINTRRENSKSKTLEERVREAGI